MEQTQNPALLQRWRDPKWQYRQACDTDIRRTFERARQEQEQKKERKQ